MKEHVFWKTTRKTTVVHRFVKVEVHTIKYDANHRQVGVPVLKSSECNELSMDDPIIEETKRGIKPADVAWKQSVQNPQRRTIRTPNPAAPPTDVLAAAALGVLTGDSGRDGEIETA